MKEKEYVVYLDGQEWCRKDTEAEAIMVCCTYEGEKEIWYEEEEI